MNGGYFARLYRHTRFWGVFDHLHGQQRVANRILGSSRGFACKGEQGSCEVEATDRALSPA